MTGLASLKLTLVAMLLLAAGALYAREGNWISSQWVAAPLAVLCVNLLAAVAMNPRFRRQPALLAFHICLLMVVGFAALGQLTRLEGRVEIAEGQPFDPAAVEIRKEGLWHDWALVEGVFAQGGIEVEYGPDVVRRVTRSEVVVYRADGRSQRVTVGDDRPLVVDGYRFYTTSNKGWAVLFQWQGADGDAQRGHLHLPSYPYRIRNQSKDWQLPSGEELVVSLEPGEVPMGEAWRLHSASRDEDVAIVLRVGEREERLVRGESVALAGGRLRFEALNLWMGYRISYDATRPWVAASAMAAVGFLSWHFWQTLGPLGSSPRTREPAVATAEV